MQLFLIGFYTGAAAIWIFALADRRNNSTEWVKNIASGVFWLPLLIGVGIRNWYRSLKKK